MGQTLECAYDFVHQVAEAFFDALGDWFSDWLLRTLIVFTHAVRLPFSMSARSSESTGGDDFGFSPSCTTL
jgi:hypothetical protein